MKKVIKNSSQFRFKKKSYYTRYLFYIMIAICALLLFLVTLKHKQANEIDLLTYSKQTLSSVKKLKIPSLKHALFYENNSKNIISASIVFKGGAALDLQGYDGISYLLANTLLQGSGGYNTYKFKKYLEDYSISLSATVQRDKIIINITALSYYRNRFFRVIDMVVNSPNLGIQEVNFAKKNLLAEYNINLTTPSYFLDKSLRKALYGNSRYFRDIKGCPKSIVKITPEILANFKTKVMTRDNVYVAVSGNISQNEATNYLARIFNKLPKSKSKISLPTINPRIRNKTFSVPIKNASQSEVYMVFNSLSPSNQRYPYAQVVNTYIGRIPDSKLFQELRNNQGLVYTVYSSLYKNALTSYWLVSLGSSMKTSDKAINAVKETLKATIKHSTYQDILIAKDWLLAHELKFFSNNSDITKILNYIQFNNYTIDEFINSRNQMNNISESDYQAILKAIDVDKVTIIKIVKPKK